MSNDSQRKPLMVSTARYERVREMANETGSTIKTFAEAMIDYICPRIESGELSLGQPKIDQTEETES